ncbi:MAG: S-layer homology domain-containing protein [Anaeromicrobium sp.]|jgi:spore germination protein YaaH|uniref:S-layer homology domain-containing protein n=1 Tax=Anaeromicrobium sp. TaxID=1929132 RepID=UPI0025EACBE5|nr:S-layer homology domain-containing protein [Anaeromicrobium sp.]MCT4594551.1 S-layer homology domain-containing protein [Anaeromicrobium sp.]
MRKRKLFVELMKISLIMTIVVTLILGGRVTVEAQKFNMSYLYFGNSNDYINYVDRTNDSLHVVAPSYLDINVDGTLNTQKLDENLIHEMHKRNVDVVPFLSNHWDKTAGEKALENRFELADQIANTVSKYNLDGVNVDIEGLTEVRRDDFTDFVRILREKIPSEKEVSVAVAANPFGWTKGWHGMYDYEELAKYSDYLMIMAYDESWSGGDPGPVASISFVEKSIQYGLNEGVPSHKMVLGIPFYGRIWNIDDTLDKTKEKSEKILGKGISLSRVDAILSTYDGNMEYVKDEEVIKATFQIKEEDPKVKLYSWGKPLSVGNYEIWFENEKSIKKKLELVQKYNIKGTGSWSLGQEEENLWEYYTMWLNGKYFVDIEDHWAEEEILKVKEKGWMVGMSESYFGPDESLTRAQGAVILVKAFDLEEKENSPSFKDVPSSHWAKKEIEILYQNEIMKGKGNDIFDPDGEITREEMAVVLYNLLGNKEIAQEDKNPYGDVYPGHWSYDGIVTMSEYGIFSGFGDGTFRPKEEVSRGQMAALMNKILNKQL